MIGVKSPAEPDDFATKVPGKNALPLLKARNMFTTQTVLTIGAEALWLTLLISAPLLLAALAAGLIVGIFQAATQINEMTLSFIPKLMAMFAVMVAAGPWMLATMLDFMRRLITGIPALIG